MSRARRLPLPTLLSIALLGAACGGADEAGSTPTPSTVTSPGATAATGATASSTPTAPMPDTTDGATSEDVVSTTGVVDSEPPTTEVPEPLVVLVTNDDGVGAPGIDALVRELVTIDSIEVVVYAPAENQSGSSDTTSAELPATTATTTASGHPAIAVAGTPADSVLVAVERDGVAPDLVVSGVNAGQNIGLFVPLSGTIGAARTAARLGVPAIAVSAGGLENSDFAAAAAVGRAEVESLLDEVAFGGNGEQVVINLNSPTCAAGLPVRGVIDVPVAVEFPAGTNGLDLVFDCASTSTAATDDATALVIGFASRSEVPADL